MNPPGIGSYKIHEQTMPEVILVVMFRRLGGRVSYSNEQASMRLIVKCMVVHRFKNGRF